MDYRQNYSRIAHMCANRELASGDARQKLRDWGVSAEDAEQIVDALIQEKFIDDARFAPLYTRDKFNFNGWGRIKIAYQLKLKGIKPAIITQALETIDPEDYFNNLVRMLNAKSRTLKNMDDYKLKTSLFRFAQSRGFESDIILSAIDEALSDE